MPETFEGATDDGINWSAVDRVAGGAQEGAQEGAQAAPNALSPGQEVAGLLLAVATVVRPLLPSVAAIYSAETCAGIGAAVDPVCRKYGWLQNGIDFAAELQAVIVLVPVLLSTAAALKVDTAALKAAKAAREAASKRTAEEASAAPVVEP